MNEIFLDTETTGLSFKEGHKIVEIACIETKELIPTGKVFHKLINPKRDVPDAAFKIHGFSREFLSDKETFDVVADDFIKFVQELSELNNRTPDKFNKLKIKTLSKEYIINILNKLSLILLSELKLLSPE